MLLIVAKDFKYNGLGFDVLNKGLCHFYSNLASKGRGDHQGKDTDKESLPAASQGETREPCVFSKTLMA